MSQELVKTEAIPSIYNDELAEGVTVAMDILIKNKTCLSYKDLKNKNIIRLPKDFLFSDVFKQTDVNEYLNTGKLNFTQDNDLFLIPCFEEGVIKLEINNQNHVKPHRVFSYYFKLTEKKETDDEILFKFKIQVYYKEPLLTHFFICEFMYELFFNKELNSVSIKTNSQKDFHEYIQDIDFKESNLILAKKFISSFKSEKYLRQFLSDIRIQSEDGIAHNELAQGEFQLAVQYINSTLYLNKTHRKGNKRKEPTQYINSGKPHPKRIFREAGKIKFYSKEIPRCPTKERIIKYKCLSWQQRGHIRRLKDGREIYVKPCTKHRSEEALSNNIKPANVTINF